MKNYITTILVAVIVAGAAFYGGMQYQSSKTPAFGGRNGQGGARQFQRGGNGGQGRPTVGQIVAIDDKTITVKLQDGSSKIVDISGSTTISKTDTATKQDLKTGDTIAAFGTDNSDGSVTAQNIQLNPMFRMRGQTTNSQQK